MRLDENCLSEATDNINYLTMRLIRYQWGFTTLHAAADRGYARVTRMILDRVADIDSKDKVSYYMRELIDCLCH